MTQRVHELLHPPARRGLGWQAGDGRASRSERLIFVAGQHDIRNDNSGRHPGRLLEQADAAMQGVFQAVESVGGRPQDVVKLFAFPTGAAPEDEVALLRRMRAQIRGDTAPVVSLVALPRLWHPDMGVLIKAVAVDNSDGGAPRVAAVPSNASPWPVGGEFSHGLRCGELAFVSAQTAKDAAGRVRHDDDIVSQARLTIDNIAHVLEAMGCTLDDVVKLNTWYLGAGTDADWRRAAEIRSGAFRFPGPGATGVPVPLRYPDGGQIRQECWALRSTDGKPLPRSLSWPVGHWDWPMRVSFQQGVRVGHMVFLGGQYSMDERGLAVDADDMASQIGNTREFIRRILVGFGATLDDLVEVTAFYKYGQSSAGPPLAARQFANAAVPLTEVPLGTLGLEGVTIEIEGFAVLPQGAA